MPKIISPHSPATQDTPAINRKGTVPPFRLLSASDSSLEVLALDCSPVSREFVSAAELAEVLGIAVKTITNNSFRVVGRHKIGGSVRYHLDTIRSRILAGLEIYETKQESKQKGALPPRRKKSILPKTYSKASYTTRKVEL